MLFPILDFSSDRQMLETLASTHLRACESGFICLLCGIPIKRKDNAKAHLAEKHMTPRQYRCPPYGKVFNRRRFRHHVTTVHPKWGGIEYKTFLVAD
jgi:hypothetical protein